jgi:hypothetical protein
MKRNGADGGLLGQIFSAVEKKTCRVIKFRVQRAHQLKNGCTEQQQRAKENAENRAEHYFSMYI